jgi:hypothetical protein
MKVLASLVGALLAASASAQMTMPMPAATCAAPVIVPGFESFAKADASALVVGHAATLALAPAQSLTFTPPLNRAPAPGSNGGTFPLVIEKAGTYRIALSDGAWIDLIGDGARLVSTAHSHGPACSGIAKIVDFALAPGHYEVQLSATRPATIKAMVIAR